MNLVWTDLGACVVSWGALPYSC